MRIGRLWIVVGILLTPVVAYADGHRAGIFGGVSFSKGSTLTGLHVAGDWSPPHPAFAHLWLVGDFSRHGGDHNGADVTRNAILFGLKTRLGFHPATASAEAKRHVGTAHLLFGGVGGDGSKDGATAIGGAYDFVLTPDARVVFRAQYDRIIRGGGAADFHRFSFGAMWRLPR